MDEKIQHQPVNVSDNQIFPEGGDNADKPQVVPSGINESKEDANETVEKSEVVVETKPEDKKASMKDKLMALLNKIDIQPLIAMEHRGEKMNDYT